jgi:PKD repeat protein
MVKALSTQLLLIAAIVFGTACKVHQTNTPGMTGPSELALSIDVTATPDTIRYDGVAQSSIVVMARDPFGEPQSGVSLRLDLSIEYGTLSSRNLVTGSDGRASAVYTSPPSPTVFVVPPQVVTIRASTVGTNYQTVQFRSATLLLVPPALIMPSPDSPVAFFEFSPTAVKAGEFVVFDAIASVARTGSFIAQYVWNWGDGDPEVTRTTAYEQHDFLNPGIYNVVLTVIDDVGRTGSISRAVTVTEGAKTEEP